MATSRSIAAIKIAKAKRTPRVRAKRVHGDEAADYDANISALLGRMLQRRGDFGLAMGTALERIDNAGGHGLITIEVRGDAEPVVTVQPTAVKKQRTIADAVADAEARGIELAAKILSGRDMLSAGEFAKMLGMTRASVNAKRQRHELLGLEGAKRGYKFPIWQCDSTTGKPFEVLPRLFEKLGDAWTVYNFLTMHHPELGGQTGREALSKGVGTSLLDAAEAQARDFA